jgi:hypothetical protein
MENGHQMKSLQLLFRAGLGVIIGFFLSFFSLTVFSNLVGYTRLDLAFIFTVPTLAFAYLFVELFPVLQKWMEQPRIGAGHFFRYYAVGFFLSLLLGYGAIGFLDEALKTSLSVFVVSTLFILAASVSGYYLVRRAAHSFRDGFLSKPLNLILCLMLPLLLTAMLVISSQFPAMFVWEYITFPPDLLGIYTMGAVVAGVGGVIALGQIEARGYYQKFRETGLFAFIKENLPGLYAGGMFFLINLVIARALNHPAFSYTSVVFETDAGWMSIFGDPGGDAINRAVHPLTLITVRSLVRLAGIFLNENWNLAPISIAAMLSGACVLMAWIFVRRATGEKTYALLFAILLGSTSAHLLFGSIVETYVFGMTSLIFFMLLIQAREQRLSVLVPVGIVVFGITVTNIAQNAIGLFFNKFGFWRVVRYCVLVVTAGVVLTVFTSVLYPNLQTFFFVPADLLFETKFVRPVYDSPAQYMLGKVTGISRAMFLYGVVAPTPLEVIHQKRSEQYPNIDLKMFDWQEQRFASYKGLANVPLAVWLVLIAGAFAFFIKNLRTTPHLNLMQGLLGCLAFNYLLHSIYGVEFFLYTPYWDYALFFFAALAYAELADKKWFLALLSIFAVMLMVNNAHFIFTVLRALDPFFAPH